MSAEVINLNPDLKKLQDEGYELEAHKDCAIIYNVPYLDASLTVRYGVLVSPLFLSGDHVKYNNDHVMYFQGDIPYRATGELFLAVFNCEHKKVFYGVETNIMLSNKPQGNYKNYYEKFTRYIQLLVSEAQAVDSSVTAKTFKRVVVSENSVFNYVDTNASRAGIMDVNEKLSGEVVGIIGLGGTGTYILDQVAKAPVSEIHLFDGDRFCQHNAFRAPGAPNVEVFSQQMMKVDYFGQLYSQMHSGVVPHPFFIDETNLDELRRMTFVFIAMDTGPSKKQIVEYLIQHSIDFVDSGIDIHRVNSSLIGMTRITAALGGDRSEVDQFISFAEPNEELYRSNVQTADLNALCAITAVIKWKLVRGFYCDNVHNNNWVFTTNDGEIK